ncbi:MAG: NAD(P)H-hydrate dehydratase [Oscillospiraceae bacterium]|jgi:NAD(P)H-hydrate epimerase|nr:NAD(P)H-hydrate dehydratase [Oscillospiraceae bacterium]
MNVLPVDEAFVAGILPHRPAEMHKGDCGRALLVCGSVGYTGAARLAAESCVRAGAGLVSLLVPRSVYPVVAASCCPEVMCRPLPEDAEGRLSAQALPEIRAWMQGVHALLAGPGLGRSEALDALVAVLTAECPAPFVADADGLNALAGHILKRTAPLILTPHEGEFRRLGGDLTEGRAAAARRMAERRRAIVVLKGHRTVTASPDGRLYGNGTGNPGMAKGGSGDVLAGLLTGLLAQRAARPDLWRADEAEVTAAGVYLHGRAGDLAAAARGVYGMTPSDLIAYVPEAIDAVLRGKQGV